jgi:hypothetical protein
MTMHSKGRERPTNLDSLVKKENRFLERERYEPKDLFLENKAYINLQRFSVE